MAESWGFLGHKMTWGVLPLRASLLWEPSDHDMFLCLSGQRGTRWLTRTRFFSRRKLR